MQTIDNHSGSGGRFSLAPMEGVTEFPFRIWMWLCSAPALQGTPFLRVTRTWPVLLPKDWAPEILINGMAQALPWKLMPQLMSPCEDDFLRVAGQLLKFSSVLELNCGCPAPTVVGKGAGSGLLLNPEAFHQFVEKGVRSLGKGSLSVKIRTGYHDTSSYRDIIRSLKGLPLHRLVVHGRTRADRYTGYADWELIAEAAKTLSVPVTGSGDITDSRSLVERLEKFPLIANAMIGRGALRNPWIFQEVKNGETVSLTYGVLKDALYSYIYLHELFLTDKNALYRLCLEGHFREPAGTNSDVWSQVRRCLEKSLCGEGGENASRELKGRSLGRLKLIWNYLRSSLPEEWFQPAVLRSRNLGAFMEALSQIAYVQNGSLALRWNSQYDWIYSGSKKPPESPQSV